MGVLSLAHHAQLVRAHEVAREFTAEQPPDAPTQVSATDLAAALYARWYAAPTTSVAPHASWSGGQGHAAQMPLVAILRAAHPGADVWQPAVVLQAGAHGAVVVRTEAGGIRAVARGDWAPEATSHVGRPCGAGDRVVVRAREGGLAEAGWWRTWGGGCETGRPPSGALTRIYLSPRPAAIHRLVPAVLAVLGEVEAPWLVKVGADLETVARPDGAVVYLPDEVAGLAAGSPARAVALLADAVTGLVRGPGPALSAPLAEGVSWVQDPGDGSSFGETVCRVLANALVSCPALLATGPANAATALGQALGMAGIDPRAPHLRPHPKEAA